MNFAGVEPTKYNVPPSSPVHRPNGADVRRYRQSLTVCADRGDIRFRNVAANRCNLLRSAGIRLRKRDYRLTTDASHSFNLSTSTAPVLQRSAEAQGLSGIDDGTIALE